MRIQKLGEASQSLLEAHIPESGVAFEQVEAFHEADFVVPRDALKKCPEEPTAAFFWPYMQEKLWYIRPEFLGKEPTAQWRIHLGGSALDVYNFGDPNKVGLEDVVTLAGNVALFGAHFPLPEHAQPKVLAVVDRLRLSANNRRFDASMATAHRASRLITLARASGALSNMPYHTDFPIPTKAAVIFHELSHFDLDTTLSQEWRDAGFLWRTAATPKRKLYETYYGSRVYIPSRPSWCITEYAKTSEAEDIAESATFYLGGYKDYLMGHKCKVLCDNDYDLKPQTPVIEPVAAAASTLQLPPILRYVVAAGKDC